MPLIVNGTEMTYNLSTTMYTLHTLKEYFPRRSASLLASFVIICFFILIGNSIVFYLYCVTTSLRNVANKLVISSSVAGTSVALLFVPFYLLFDEMIKSKSMFVTSISGFLNSYIGFAMLFNIGALTGERYIAIFLPLHYENVMIKRYVVFILLVVWGFPFVLSVLPLFFSLAITNHSKLFIVLKAYQGFLSIFMLLILTLIFIVYVRFWKISRSHLNFDKQQRAASMRSIHCTKSSSEFLDSSASDYTACFHCQSKKSFDAAEETCSNCISTILFKFYRKEEMQISISSPEVIDDPLPFQRKEVKIRRKYGFSMNSTNFYESNRLLGENQQNNINSVQENQSDHERNDVCENKDMTGTNLQHQQSYKVSSESALCLSINASIPDEKPSSSQTTPELRSMQSQSPFSPVLQELTEEKKSAGIILDNKVFKVDVHCSLESNEQKKSEKHVTDDVMTCLSNDDSVFSSENEKESCFSDVQDNGKPPMTPMILSPHDHREGRKCFAKDLTRRLSILSNGIEAGTRDRKLSTLSITINEQIPDETIYNAKPKLKKVSQANLLKSPRKLSVDWTPKKGKRKHSAPVFMNSGNNQLLLSRQPFKTEKNQLQKRRVSFGGDDFNQTNLFPNLSDLFARRHSADTSMLKNPLFPAVQSFDQSASEHGSKVDLDNSVNKSDSSLSFHSCASVFSCVVKEGEGTSSSDPSPISESRVSFATGNVTTSPAKCLGKPGNIKGIMRRSATKQSNKKHNKLVRSKTTIDRNRKSKTYFLSKAKSLPCSGTGSVISDYDKSFTPEYYHSAKNSSLCNYSSPCNLGSTTNKRRVRAEDTASVKRARYKNWKNVFIDTGEIDYQTNDEWKAHRKYYSSSSTPSHDCRSFLSLIPGGKRQSSSALSTTSRLTKSRNSYASVVSFAKEFLNEMKHTRVIAYIFLTNASCWLPLIFINLMDAVGYYYIITFPLILTSIFLFLLNALLMPFIYAFCKNDFKNALKRCVKRILKKT